jgi:hypothetical protein
VLLDRLRAADLLDFSRVTVDTSHVPAKRGRSSPKVGPSPVDRARPGLKASRADRCARHPTAGFVRHDRRSHPRLFPGLTCGISVPTSTLRRDCPTWLRVWRSCL